MKRLLSIVLIACLSLSAFVSLGAYEKTYASEKVRVYFYNSENWSSVYAYAWDSSGALTDYWCGTDVSSSKQGGYYSVDVPLGSEETIYIIFNNGSGLQTCDISLDTSRSSEFMVTPYGVDNNGKLTCDVTSTMGGTPYSGTLTDSNGIVSMYAYSLYYDEWRVLDYINSGQMNTDSTVTWYSDNFDHTSPNLKIEVYYQFEDIIAKRGDSFVFGSLLDLYSDDIGGAVGGMFDYAVLEIGTDLDNLQSATLIDSITGYKELNFETHIKTLPCDVSALKLTFYGDVRKVFNGSNDIFELGQANVTITTPWYMGYSGFGNIPVDTIVDGENQQIIIGNNIFETLGNLFKFVVTMPSLITNAIGDFFDNLTENVGSFFDDLGTDFSNGFNSLKTSFGGFISGLSEDIGGYFSGLAEDIVNAFESAFDEHSGGGVALPGPDIEDLPSLDEYFNPSETSFFSVINAILENEIVLNCMRIALVLGVVGFVIFG